MALHRPLFLQLSHLQRRQVWNLVLLSPHNGCALGLVVIDLASQTEIGVGSGIGMGWEG